MTDQIANMPTEVEDLAMMACRNVQRVIGVEPDFTHETLPLVDQYLRELPHDSPAEEIEQALATVGCYFGEVARRLLDGRWAITTDPPRKWRVELINCFFHFRPVGMAGEVFYREVSDEYDGAFATLRPVVGADGVFSAGGLGGFAYHFDLGWGVVGKGIDGNDDGNAKEFGRLDVVLHVAEALFEQVEVFGGVCRV